MEWLRRRSGNIRLKITRRLVLSDELELQGQFTTFCNVLGTNLIMIKADLDRFDSAKEFLESLSLHAERFEFEIAVIGAFSRGKSTLINAILGTNLLPTGILPTTANRTHFHASSNGNTRAYYFPHESALFPVDRIKESVANGREIVIEHPSVCLPSGVSLIDTPGFDGNDDSHDELAARSINTADVCLFLCKPSPGIGNVEQKMLSKIYQTGASVILVQNESDTLDNETDVERALAHNLKAAKATIGVTPKAFVVSASQALEAKTVESKLAVSNQWADFESYLWILAWVGRVKNRSSLVQHRLNQIPLCIRTDLKFSADGWANQRTKLQNECVQATSLRIDLQKKVISAKRSLESDLKTAWQIADVALAKLVTETANSNSLWYSFGRMVLGDSRKTEWSAIWSPIVAKLREKCLGVAIEHEIKLQSSGLINDQTSTIRSVIPNSISALPSSFSDKDILDYTKDLRTKYEKYCVTTAEKIVIATRPSIHKLQRREESLKHSLARGEYDQEQLKKSSHISKAQIQTLCDKLNSLNLVLDEQMAAYLAVTMSKPLGGMKKRKWNKMVKLAVASLNWRR